MKTFSIIVSLLFLYSCASAPLPALLISGSGSGYVTASWYGGKFHGRQTASGERYDMYGFTAAHKTMKFGTQLRVTNPDNNRSVEVIVNDRGPFIRGRDLDLSYGAAHAIGHVEKGVGRVKIEHLGRDMRYVKRMPFTPSQRKPAEQLTIQLGSFSDKQNALRLKQGLSINYKDVYMTSAIINSRTYYRVKVGTFTRYDKAAAVAEKLADEGYNPLITSSK